MRDIRAHVRYGAGDAHAWQLYQFLYLHSRAGTNDVKSGIGMLGTHGRQNVLRKPLHRIDVGPVVHRTSEHNDRFIGWIGMHVFVFGRKIVGVHAIAEKADFACALRRHLLE